MQLPYRRQFLRLVASAQAARERPISYAATCVPTRSVTTITFLLDPNDTGNFTRAFKRWTRMS